MDQKAKVLEFLYGWAKDKTVPIPHVKPSMVDDLDRFITSLMADAETRRAVASMSAKKAIELDKDLQNTIKEEQNAQKDSK